MRIAVIMAAICFTIAGCSQDSSNEQYNKLVAKELASGKKVDSVFYGIYLGMPQHGFFMHCWEMNKKGLFTDGTDSRGNMCVLYKLPNELKYPASMNFYPDFKDSSIWKMRASFHYNGWAPWNKHLDSDHLLEDVLAMYKKWYSAGNPFMLVKEPQKVDKYVKIDGNRKITLQKSDEVVVDAEYTDLLVEGDKSNTDGR